MDTVNKMIKLTLHHQDVINLITYLDNYAQILKSHNDSVSQDTFYAVQCLMKKVYKQEQEQLK